MAFVKALPATDQNINATQWPFIIMGLALPNTPKEYKQASTINILYFF